MLRIVSDLTQPGGGGPEEACVTKSPSHVGGGGQRDLLCECEVWLSPKKGLYITPCGPEIYYLTLWVIRRFVIRPSE